MLRLRQQNFEPLPGKIADIRLLTKPLVESTSPNGRRFAVEGLQTQASRIVDRINLSEPLIQRSIVFVE